MNYFTFPKTLNIQIKKPKNDLIVDPHLTLLVHLSVHSPHTRFMVLGPTLSSNDSLVVLKFCSLNLVAIKLACLELHKIVFGVSNFLLIAGSQGLLNLLSTNH
jgi:hypothetical protein